MKVYDVFISYRRSDGQSIADALCEYLSTRGLRVFLDRNDVVDGHYFTTQLEDKVRNTPNYVLIGTADVFKFRTNEKDWVFEEIAIATAEYEKNSKERTITVLAPDTTIFPQKENLPEAVCNIIDAQRIFLPSAGDYQKAFYRVLEAVTQVNRWNLWQAAHRWLEESKRPGGRFAGLHISESILPNAARNNRSAEMPILVYGKEKTTQLLMEAIGSTNHHHYLVGEGGIGKTTALMHIMNAQYAEKNYTPDIQIPIFVELSFAPDTFGALYEGGNSSFIRRAIFKQLRADRSIKQVSAKEVSDIDEVFASTPYDVAVKPITAALSKMTSAPEYLLLLDGLNEVSSVMIEETGLTVAQMVTKEIELLLTECPNVRVILTSRSDEVYLSEGMITRLYLTGIEDSVIEEYLENAGIPKARIVKALNDENLRKTLRIPLFLTMYALLTQSEEISTQGEILKTFLNERRKDLAVYSVQQRLTVVEKNVSRGASMGQKKRIDADMQSFILDFLLPEIAWHMERKGEFYLRIRDVRKIIAPVLTDSSDTAVCGEFGREIFSKYRSGASAKKHTFKIAQEIRKRFSDADDMGEIAENVVECCVFSLGIMQESNSKYGFSHQHLRDYFAAVRNINTLRLADYLFEEGETESALECMNSTFRDEPIGYNVRRFMGEYLCEHKNAPYFLNGRWNCSVPAEKCDQTLIERSLCIYRNVTEDVAGYGVHSLLKLLEEARGMLAGINLSDLDLSSCRLNGTGIGINGLAAKLNRAKIKKESLFSEGHKSRITDVQFSTDGARLLSASADGSVKIWDVKTDTLLSSFSHSGGVCAARFVNEDKSILSVCDNGGERLERENKTLCRWDLASEELVCVAKTFAHAEKMVISQDEQYVLIAASYGLQIVTADDFSYVGGLYVQENENLVDVSFVGPGLKIAVLLHRSNTALPEEKKDETILEIWNMESIQKESDTKVSGKCVGMTVTPHGNIIVFFHRREAGETKGFVFDTNALQQLSSFTCSTGEEEIHKVNYSKNGRWYAFRFDYKVNIYSAKSNTLVHSFALNRCWSMDFDATDNLVAFGTLHGEVITYSVGSLSQISMIKGADSNIYSFKFSPDNRYIATMGGMLELWDAGSMKLVNKKNVRRGPVNVMEFSPSGEWINNWPGVSGCLSVPELQTRVTGDAVCFDRVGVYYARIKNGDDLEQSLIYTLKDNLCVCALNDMIVFAFLGDKALAFCNRGMKDYSVTYSHIAIVDIHSGEILDKLVAENDAMTHAVVSHRHIAALTSEGKLCVWKADAKQQNPIMQDQTLGKYTMIAFSEDGRYLIEYTQDKTVVREPATLKEVISRNAGYIQCTSKYLVVTSLSHQENIRYRHILIYSMDSFNLIHSHCINETDFSRFAPNMSFAHISPDNTKLLLREGDQKIGVYRLSDSNSTDSRNPVARIGGIISFHGMDYLGVDLSTIRLDKALTDDEKYSLQQYGAIIHES